MTRQLSLLSLISLSLLASTPMASGSLTVQAALEPPRQAVEPVQAIVEPPPAAEAPPAAATQTPPAIRVVVAERREIVETIPVTGTVIAREEAAVGSDVNGLTVLELRADQGDWVTKGQVLAVLDRSLLETQLVQADANRAQAEANIAQIDAQVADAEVGVRQAEEELERAQSLQKQGVSSKAALDNAVNAADSARARLLSAQKAVTASEAQLAVIDAQKQNVVLQIAKTELRAPADGLVLARDATLGGVVSAGGAPLFRIAIKGEFELAADVAESALPRLENGMKATIRLAGLAEPIVGKIRRISPEIDQASRLGSIRISLETTGKARRGNFARGDVETLRREGVAVLASAVVYRENDAFLQKVANGAIATVPVVLGARAGDYVEIISGVNEGDEVVSKAGTFVADGDRVTPIRAERMGAIQP